MSACWVTECKRTARSANNQPLPVPQLGQTQFLSASATSSTFPNAVNAKWVRIYADVDIVVELGDSPTANLLTSYPVGAHSPDYVAIEYGDKVAIRTQI